MDTHAINVTCRNKLGFFLTLSAESAENKDEHEMFAHAARLAMDELHDKRIRSANLLKNLSVLKDIIETVGDDIKKSADKYGFEDMQDERDADTYASLIVIAAIANYNRLVERRRDGSKRSAKKED